MRVLVDVDGVLCEDLGYEIPLKLKLKAKPFLSNIEKVNQLKANGVEIILYTARLPRERAITEQWLKENNVQYDAIVYGKPWCDYCVDDRCATFSSILLKLYPKTNRAEGQDEVQKREIVTPTKTQRRTSGNLAVNSGCGVLSYDKEH